MKAITNITGIVLMVALLPFVWIVNKLADLKSTEPPEPIYPIRHTKKRTVYPDDDMEDFNHWSTYIHNQLN